MKFFARSNIFIFVTGILFSIASKLRFPNLSVGFGEMLLVLSSFISIGLYLLNKMKAINHITQPLRSFVIFWSISFFLLTFGFLHGIIIIQGHTFDDASHDAGAYIFVFIVIFLFWFNNITNETSFETLIKYYVIVNAVFFIFLAYKVLTQDFEFLGIDLRFGLFRFSGFSENPNQLAVYCTIHPFFIISILKYYTTNFWQKIALFLYLVATLIVGFATLSDGLVLSWICGTCCLFFFGYIQLGYRQTTKLQMKWLIILLKYIVIPLVIIAGAISTLYLMNNYASDVYEDGGQGDERVNRWKIGLNAIKISPIFGFGPGSFSGISRAFENEEAHNTFIDWTLSTGILGLVLYLSFLFFITKNVWKNKLVLSGIVAISVCLCFGFFLRHPFYWFDLLFLYSLSSYFKKKEQ